MLIVRLLLVFFVPAILGVLLGLVARKRCTSLVGAAIVAVGGALIGLTGALALDAWYPALFDNVFTWQIWFEWTPFVQAPEFLLMFLPRSLFTMLVGLLIGIVVARPSLKSKSALAAFAACVLAFAGTWVVEARHAPSGTEVTHYVYRISNLEEDRDAWSKQSEEWVPFLEWNLTPFIGYESFDFELANKMQDRMGGPVPKAGKGESVFVFVTEYRRDGKVVATDRTLVTGFRTAAELRRELWKAISSHKAR